MVESKNLIVKYFWDYKIYKNLFLEKKNVEKNSTLYSINKDNHIKALSTSSFKNCCQNIDKNSSTFIPTIQKQSSFNTYKNFSSLIRRSLSRSKKPNPEINNETESLTHSPSINTFHLSTNNVQNNKVNQIQSHLTFTQRIKLHKGLRTGNIPTELLSQKLLLQKEQQQKRQLKTSIKIKRNEFKNHCISTKALSSDAICELNKTTYVTEALFALADSQPIVARLFFNILFFKHYAYLI